jgi:antitoxin (DNA-binding transcriptional repressor) of toxin-antitoxin stability system
MKKSRIVLAIVLSISLLATGCSAQWISIALADLPVLTQMALNIGTIITTLQSGQQISAADAAAIQNISAQASKDLNLLESLYNEYKSNPSTSVLQKIQNLITDINQNLPALLQAAHIGNPVLSARVAAGVNLILTTVASFAALIPQSSSHFTVKRVAHPTSAIPKASDLKKQWNQQVCGPISDSALDFSATGCTVK